MKNYQNKIFVKILITTIIILGWAVGALAATFSGELGQSFIRYRTIDWQTYEFYAISNVEGITAYEWTVDGRETFSSSTLHYYFDSGDHRISLATTDVLGNRAHDSVNLKVTFWSWHNNTLMWFFYGFVIMIIVYYWALKLFYLVNKRRLKREVREFLSVLDTGGYVEHIVANILNKK